MALAKCVNNHTYNKDKYEDTCPICGVVAKKYKDDGKTQAELEAMYKLPEDQYVCAWLVCTEGINKGRSYPIHPGKNFIGSGDGMDVQILGDSKVDRDRHAILAYDDSKWEANLLPGESKGLVYHEETAIYVPTPLKAFSAIGIGASKFRYIPLCGDEHKWKEQGT
jgi:hypothetical protein